MSTTAIHGSKQVVKIEDPDNLGTYLDISEKCSAFNPTISRQNVPTPGFGEGDIGSIVGQRDANASLTVYLDQDLRDLLWSWILDQDNPCSIKYGPEGDDDGLEKQTADYWILSVPDGGDVNSAITVTVPLQRTGATTRGTWSSGA